MTRRRRIVLVVGVLVGLQLAALGVYRVVERRRAAPARPFQAQVLADPAPAPAIEGTRAGGAAVALTWPAAGPRLVHFWATWCEPCRRELPGLLALARALELELVAIAVDDDWGEIGLFFDGAVPPEIVIEAAGRAHRALGVSMLPDSYLVDRTGRVVERYAGERDWRAPAARAHLRARLGAL